MSGLLNKVVDQLGGQKPAGSQQSSSSGLLHKLTDAATGQKHAQHAGPMPAGSQQSSSSGLMQKLTDAAMGQKHGQPSQGQHQMGQGQGYSNPPYNQGFGYQRALHIAT